VAVIGYNTIGGSTDTYDSTVSTASRLLAANQYAPASGDTATTFNIYIAGGGGADSTISLGLWDVTGLGINPANATLLVSTTMLITAAMKAAPALYTATVNWSLTSYVGKTIAAAIAAVDVGSILVAADSVANASSAVFGGGDVFPSPIWSSTTYGSSNSDTFYFNVTSSGGGTATIAWVK
jgi:hypothetical protein